MRHYILRNIKFRYHQWRIDTFSFALMLKSWANFTPRSFDFYKLAVRAMSSRLDLFQSIGLSEQKAKETLKNEALASHLENVVTTVSKSTCSFINKFYLL